MSGLALINIGKRRTGKTTLSKANLDSRPEGMPVKIYDINQEYGEYYKEPFQDWEEFMNDLVHLKEHYILIEEATIFFDTSSRFEQMKNILVRARHTQNIIQLNFHSFLSVPKNIYNLLDFVTILKTNDTLKTVRGKYDNPEIIEAYQDSLKSNDPFFNRTISLQ